jgi:peptidoglycan/xylan/chitin deacetylase (PgdA/CDA1 family)
MALSATTDSGGEPTAPYDEPRRGGGSNDAFSFWKLPLEWKSSLASSIEESKGAAERYLFEQYLSSEDRQPPTKMQAYYLIKNLIPAAVRHRLNSAAIKLRGNRDFPRWPCESALVDYWRDWLQISLRTLNASDGWHIGFWPDGLKCCIVLTHDVEAPLGMSRMEQMADLEERYNFRSAWNLPLSQYAIDWNLIDRLRDRGFEFGAHGLSHDGRLFRSESDFSELAPILHRLAHDHGLAGFRAPSTLRRAEWISRLEFDFDCSFSDSDPYEPQPGGTCSVFPFFLSNLVELPYTMPQDHTLIHLLRRNPTEVWSAKARWIEALGGMILTLVHPDYCGAGTYLKEYETLLQQLSEFQSAWRALPSEVSAWWRGRDRMKLTLKNDDGSPTIEGSGSERAVARKLSSEPLLR